MRYYKWMNKSDDVIVDIPGFVFDDMKSALDMENDARDWMISDNLNLYQMENHSPVVELPLYFASEMSGSSITGQTSEKLPKEHIANAVEFFKQKGIENSEYFHTRESTESIIEVSGKEISPITLFKMLSNSGIVFKSKHGVFNTENTEVIIGVRTKMTKVNIPNEMVLEHNGQIIIRTVI